MATHSSILAWETMDRGTWWTTIHDVTQSQRGLSDYNGNGRKHLLEETVSVETTHARNENKKQKISHFLSLHNFRSFYGKHSQNVSDMDECFKMSQIRMSRKANS